MRAFKEPNLNNNWKCPICLSNDKKEVVLVKIEGTEDGNIAEAEQIHLDCINLTINKPERILYQAI